MPDKLVIGISSSALFNLNDCDHIFREQGRDAYISHQKKNVDIPLSLGVAAPFIKRILALNILRPDDPLVEIVLMSRNNSETGIRVMKSIEHHQLGATRAVFLEGRSPIKYIESFGCSLFLSTRASDINLAIDAGHSAGHVLKSKFIDDPVDHGLRLAFDFDGVLADDESESVFRGEGGLQAFEDYERKLACVSHNPGPILPFLTQISKLQKLEEEYTKSHQNYEPQIEISLVTARGTKAHERVVSSMNEWGIHINSSFFLAGMDKSSILESLKPHMYFDDQKSHLQKTAPFLPSVHVPFGIANQY
jgi:5'-nucleotidase